MTATTTGNTGNATLTFNVRELHGPWYIAVPGDSPAVSGPYTLTATVSPPPAPVSPFITATVPTTNSFTTSSTGGASPPPSCTADQQTLILYNSARLAQSYATDPDMAVLTSTLQTLAADPSVDGCLVDLSQYPALWNTDPAHPGAYQQWDQNPSDPAAANYVARASSLSLPRSPRRGPRHRPPAHATSSSSAMTIRFPSIARSTRICWPTRMRTRSRITPTSRGGSRPR